MSNRITHIRKPNVHSTAEHITHVRGVNGNNEVFVFTVAQVISYIRLNYVFYVQVGRDRAIVQIGTSRAGNEYIRTTPDGTVNDNLLSLEQF